MTLTAALPGSEEEEEGTPGLIQIKDRQTGDTLFEMPTQRTESIEIT